MKRKYSRLVKQFASGLLVLGVAACGNAFASQAPENNGQGLNLGNGWLLTSTGGLAYENPNCADYWFRLSGILRLDAYAFMGSYRDKQNNFPSGSRIREAELDFDGGLGRNWEYTVSLEFDGEGSIFRNTWLSYMGFADNNQVYAGIIQSSWFGLDNANSITWQSFMEKSLVTNTFYPGDGVGVMTDFWWEDGAITLTATQSNQSESNSVSNIRDRWRTTVRATVAPKHCDGDVWHFGVSGAYREVKNTRENGRPIGRIEFAVFAPGVVARNAAAGEGNFSLVSTTTGNLDTLIQANNVRMFNVEAARQIGPFMLEGEYTNVYVHRTFASNFPFPQGSLRFSGWNIQTRYLLTGEHHAYDVRDGQFGSVKPCGTYGAFEVAARYDFVDLNDKNVRGGTQHDVTLGLNWFLNQQVRFTANYIRASIHPANDAAHRNLDIIGLRAQVRFK